MEDIKTHPKKELFAAAGKVDFLSWPESQGCIGCPYAGLVLCTGESAGLISSSAYVCLCNDRSKVLCDNPEGK